MKAALARPTDRGEPFSSWSLTKLRDHLVRTRIVPAVSRSQLWRILHDAGIRFQHHKTWKASPDPEFEARKNRVLDLYAHPPAGSRVLCLDEFGPLNLQPRLGHGWQPMRHPARLRATYKRTAGVRHLLAAYDPATGRLYGHIRATKTWREVRELLRTLRARFAEHLVVVLDNFSPHHKRELRDWVADHDIELAFLPTYSSWLNLIECQFAALRKFTLNGTDYPSHAEQDAAIHAYLRWHNRNSRPAKPWRIKAEVHHSLPEAQLVPHAATSGPSQRRKGRRGRGASGGDGTNGSCCDRHPGHSPNAHGLALALLVLMPATEGPEHMAAVVDDDADELERHRAIRIERVLSAGEDAVGMPVVTRGFIHRL